MRATCVLTTIPVATAGRAPVKNLFALTPPPPPPPLMSSRATAAMPVGPDEDEIEKDADRLDNDRPPPPAPPLLALSVVSATGRCIEGAEAVASEKENAGGERRYKSGAKAPDSLNARRHTCLVLADGTTEGNKSMGAPRSGTRAKTGVKIGISPDQEPLFLLAPKYTRAVCSRSRCLHLGCCTSLRLLQHKTRTSSQKNSPITHNNDVAP